MKDIKKIENFLWEKLKSGDIDALGELYDLYIDILFLYGIQISRDKEYVMDCIHDLFLDIYKYRANLTTTNNVQSYLIKSLKRKINKKYNSKMILVGNEDSIGRKSQGNFTRSFEEEIILSERLSQRKLQLTNALSLLTKRQKKGLFLRFNEERPYEEIAKIMNVSVQTSRTIVYRGIKKLRKHLTLFIFYIGGIFFY
ncbi:MAG: sigma-70 family RNA polymerase sigma factor [Bacteroidota bacterium]